MSHNSHRTKTYIKVPILAHAGYGTVNSHLQKAADEAEAAHNALSSSPTAESYQNHIQGVYNSETARLIEDLRTQINKGLPLKITAQNAASAIDALTVSKEDGGLDDRLYLLEEILVFLSRYPEETAVGQSLHEKTVSLLWNDLPHPPASLIGRKYQYRSADGSGTSIWNPDMGKAGSSYARSVQSIHPLPANRLPSPELLFDTLLKREEQVDHPAGLSSFFFAFANLIIHSLFSTDHLNPEPINLTSSYLDLSPLYGNSQADQDSIRLYDGTGRIHPDTFADSRLLRMPPSSPALLVMFSRNHNYIVQKLLAINERGIWSNPPPQDAAAKKQQDEDLFQTARLVNCGWFKSMIFGDYLASILGMVRDGNDWSLDPMLAFRDSDHRLVERGNGNVVSIEFAALYHFHSSISAHDEEWAEKMFRAPQLFGDTPWDDITIKDYQNKIKQLLDQQAAHPIPPNTWTFGGMKRDATGKFDDADLAKILQDATEHSASAFKARGTPHAMRIIEIMAIQQNRDWGSCSLNEFRKFLGLRPYSSFEEWNPRPEIADAARRLYQHPDNIELYVGLQAEESKTFGPGRGLCPGFTMSRAILADAVALVRGDRFFTNDFTSFNLTAWGYNDCQRYPKNSAKGGVLPTLLLRHLPSHYSPDSSYTNFPMVTPDALNGYFNVAGLSQKYSFSRPLPVGPVQVIKTYEAAHAALRHPALVSEVPELVQPLLPGRGYLGTLHRPAEHGSNRALIKDTFATPSAVIEQVAFMERTTSTLINAKSYTLVGANRCSVNIVRDVLNLIPIYFISSFVLGLPLKTDEQPWGTLLDQEVYLQLRDIYNYLFLDNCLDSQVAQQETMQDYCQNFLNVVRAQLIAVSPDNDVSLTARLEEVYHNVVSQITPTHEWLQRITRSGKDREELSNNAVALAIVCSVELAQALTHVVDAFLDPASLPTVSALAKLSDPESTEKLKMLIASNIHVRPPVPGVYRRATCDVVTEDGIRLSENDRVYISFIEAGINYAEPEPEADDIEGLAPAPQPILSGELVNLLGTGWLLSVMLPVIRAIFSLDDLQRAPGTSGKLISIIQEVEGTQVPMYLDSKEFSTPWSSDMTINYTGESVAPH